MGIIRWFLHSPVFEVITAIILSVIVLSIILKCLSYIFVLVEKEKFRAWVCIGIGVVSSVFCRNYSNWGFLTIPLVTVLAFFCYIIEHGILLKADNIKYAVDKSYDENSLDMWGFVCMLALLGPILVNFNIIICKYYNIDTIGWFKFYWTFKMGIFQYNIVRYAIALTPWIVLFSPVLFLNLTRNKDWLIDLGKAYDEEKAYILNMNPDAIMGVTAVTEEERESQKKEGTEKVPKDESDEILEIISKFI